MGVGVGLAAILPWMAFSPVESKAQAPAWVQSTDPASLRAEYARQVAETDDPEELTALALFYAGRGWALAAEKLAGHQHNHETRTQMDRFRQGLMEDIRGAKTVEDRQLAAFRLLYESVGQVAGLLALARGDKVARKEVMAVATEVNSLGLNPHPERNRTVAVLGDGLLSMLGLAVQCTEKGRPFTPYVEQEMALAVVKAKAVAERQDLIYRDKMFLLALSSARASFRMLCLLNVALDSQLTPEIDSLRRTWRKKAGDGQPPARALVVTYTAIAEASFEAISSLVGR